MIETKRVYHLSQYLGEHLIQDFFILSTEVNWHEWLNSFIYNTETNSHPLVRLEVETFEIVNTENYLPRDPLPLIEVTG